MMAKTCVGRTRPGEIVPMFLVSRFEILEQLGQGGFGTTFLAEDTHMPSRRKCVVKQLRPEAPNQRSYDVALMKFQEEAEVLEQLNHPQIPQLYGYFEQEGQFFLVQEWIEGQTLEARVRTAGPLPEHEVREMLSSLLPVLEYLHSAQPREVIHRDIKPDNVILRQPGDQPVLIDFGAVKQVLRTVVTSSGSVMCSVVIGSGGFTPPEQAAQRVVYSSDLYSLGMTAIYGLTGKAPETMELDPHTSHPRWEQYVPSVSPELAAVLNKAIQLDPRDRYRNATEMLEALPVAMDNRLSDVPAKFSSPQVEAVATSGRLPISANRTPISVGRLPISVGHLPTSAGQVPISADRSPTSSGQLPTSVGRTLLYTDPVPTSSGQIPTSIDPVPASPRTQVLPRREPIAAPMSRSWKAKAGLAAAVVASLAVGAAGVTMISNGSHNGSRNQVAVAEQRQLTEAKQSADTGNYQAAINQANQISPNSDSRAEAEALTKVWATLREAEAMVSANKIGAAIAKVIAEVSPNSPAAEQAWEKVAQWSYVELGASMDKEVKPLNLSPPERKLKVLGVNSLDAVDAKTRKTPIQTKFGSSPITIWKPNWPQYEQPTEADLAADERSWADPWRESFAVAADQKMQLSFLYGCSTHIVLQNAVRFDPSLPLPLMKAQVRSMLKGNLDSEVEQQLEKAHQGEAVNATYDTGTFRGVIKQMPENQILITVRKA
jgi:serine/threonine-protein kinase